jgi:hypothetical protein
MFVYQAGVLLDLSQDAQRQATVRTAFSFFAFEKRDPRIALSTSDI